jgi:hypothetical protein
MSAWKCDERANREPTKEVMKTSCAETSTNRASCHLQRSVAFQRMRALLHLGPTALLRQPLLPARTSAALMLQRKEMAVHVEWERH